MTTQEVADKLVAMNREGKEAEVYDELYAPDAVSLEMPNAGMPEFERCDGVEAIKKKVEWWKGAMEVHGMEVSEPLVADGFFAVRYNIDATHKESGEKQGGAELGVYQVRDGKIVKEQFFWSM
jgi:ketosteroid isomerase-like protein